MRVRPPKELRRLLGRSKEYQETTGTPDYQQARKLLPAIGRKLIKKMFGEEDDALAALSEDKDQYPYSEHLVGPSGQVEEFIIETPHDLEERYELVMEMMGREKAESYLRAYKAKVPALIHAVAIYQKTAGRKVENGELQEQTVRDNINKADKFIQWFTEQYPNKPLITDVTQRHTKAYRSWLREHAGPQGRAASDLTVRSRITAVSVIYEAVIEEYTGVEPIVNPCAGLNKGLSKKTTTKKRAFTAGEYTSILEHLGALTKQPALYDIFILCTYYGMRIGEACDLQAKHFLPKWPKEGQAGLVVPGTKKSASRNIIPCIPGEGLRACCI